MYVRSQWNAFQVMQCSREAGSLPARPEKLEQEGKDVDDVQVDAERGKDVLFRAHGISLVPYQQLGIKRQELWEREEGEGESHPGKTGLEIDITVEPISMCDTHHGE